MRKETDPGAEPHSLHRITSRILKKLDDEMDKLKAHRYNREHKEEYLKSILELPRHTLPQRMAIQDKVIEETLAVDMDEQKRRKATLLKVAATKPRGSGQARSVHKQRGKGMFHTKIKTFPAKRQSSVSNHLISKFMKQ